MVKEQTKAIKVKVKIYNVQTTVMNQIDHKKAENASTRKKKNTGRDKMRQNKANNLYNE